MCAACELRLVCNEQGDSSSLSCTFCIATRIRQGQLLSSFAPHDLSTVSSPCSIAGSDHILREYHSQHASARYESTPRPNATPSQSPRSGTSSAKCLRWYLLTYSLSPQVPIESVSDQLLLSIFRYFLDVSPRDWPRLVHTCRKWRRIVLASQGTLRLRLFCTHGITVQKILHVWPALPIVVEYGGLPTLDPPVPEDEDNVIAALKQSDRVISICLTVTRSLVEKLSAIEKPFSELQDLVLLSQDDVPLTLPITFQCGQRLRHLHSTGIAFPALLQPLYSTSSTNLINLQLHDAFLPQEFSPLILKNILSEMTQLRSLSLHFCSTIDYHFPVPSYGECVVLLVLTHLDYQGSMSYLKGIVTMVDAPSLESIEITFNNPFLTLPKLIMFIDLIEMHRSHHGAYVWSSEPTVSFSLERPGSHMRLKFQSSSKPSLMQISSMAQICLDFSIPLFNDKGYMYVCASRPSGRMASSHNRKLLEPLDLFTGEKSLHLDTNHWVHILHTSQPRRHENVLPPMDKLYIPQPGSCHAFLREVVVSVMASRRLSGYPIAVEYEERRDIIEQRETGAVYGQRKDHSLLTWFKVEPFSQQVTIETIPEDIFLNVFHHCMAATPRIWPILAWVCRRWRHIVFASPLGLNLRLYCTHGMPVLKSLDCWPTLPIIVEYGGVPNLDPPTPKDNDNIIAALKQSGRVGSISLTVTSSLLEKFSAISEPLSELEELVLLSQDSVQQTLPSTFLWGSRLRTLRSTRIAFPSLPPLLLPCQDLVDLQLHEIPSSGYFSPEAFTNALSGTPQLRSLTLHLLSFPRRRSYLSLPPSPGQRIVLAALAHLKYRGTSMYLDSFVGRIDAPRLEDIEIRLFSQPTMDASQLGRFIQRTEMHTSLSHAKVETDAHAISISFTNSDVSTHLRLHISCKQLDWQLSCMAQVCDQISSFLFHVSDVGIDTAQPLGRREDVNDEQWLDLLYSFKFSEATNLWVANELTTDILCVLGHANEQNTAILPSLRHIRVQKPIEMDGPLWNSVQSFITSRSISGRPVQVDAPSYRCHICYDNFLHDFEEQHELKRHLRDKHRYQILCSYCGEFECTPGQSGLFRVHLGDKHREIVRRDVHISKPSSIPFQIDSLVNWHSSLRAPNTVPPCGPPSEFTQLPSLIARDSDNWTDAGDMDSDGDSYTTIFDSEDSMISSWAGSPWGAVGGPVGPPKSAVT